MKSSCFAILLLPFLFLSLAAQNNVQQAEELGVRAIRLIDEGKFGEAYAMLDEATELAPNITWFRYEQALIHVMKQEYEEGVEVLEEIIDADDANDRYYSLMGSAHDYLGDPEKAIEVYDEGLEKFPDSGPLYLERGIMERKIEEYNEALNYWEQGIYRAPAYPSNYFRAAELYCMTDTPGWGLLYGEVLRNLEPTSARSAAMSDALFNAYNQAIIIKKVSETEDSVKVELFGDLTITVDPETHQMMMPFEVYFEMTFVPGTVELISSGDTAMTISGLTKMRSAFITAWYQGGRDKKFPVELFDRHKDLIDKGLFEVYNYWLLGAGSEEAKVWVGTHEDELKRFAEWMGEHPMHQSADKAFSRIRLKPVPFVGEDELEEIGKSLNANEE